MTLIRLDIKLKKAEPTPGKRYDVSGPALGALTVA
jgi:hypothetical protein